MVLGYVSGYVPSHLNLQTQKGKWPLSSIAVALPRTSSLNLQLQYLTEPLGKNPLKSLIFSWTLNQKSPRRKSRLASIRDDMHQVSQRLRCDPRRRRVEGFRLIPVFPYLYPHLHWRRFGSGFHVIVFQ